MFHWRKTQALLSIPSSNRWRSERSKKTVTQALRYHVDQHQKGWPKPCRVHFNIMNTVNTLPILALPTSMGRSLALDPAVTTTSRAEVLQDYPDAGAAVSLWMQLALDTMEAKRTIKMTALSLANRRDLVCMFPDAMLCGKHEFLSFLRKPVLVLGCRFDNNLACATLAARGYLCPHSIQCELNPQIDTAMHLHQG